MGARERLSGKRKTAGGNRDCVSEIETVGGKREIVQKRKAVGARGRLWRQERDCRG